MKSQVGSSEIVFLLNLLRGPSALACAGTAPPTYGRVVVVSTGVCNKFARIIMWAEAGTLRIVSEGKLEQAHAGKAELFSKRFYLGSNHTKVFGNEWKFFQFRL